MARASPLAGLPAAVLSLGGFCFGCAALVALDAGLARSWRSQLWRQCSLVLTVKPSSRPAKIPDCSSNFDNAAPSSPSSLAKFPRLDDGHPTPGQLTSIARPAICEFPLCSLSVTSGREAPSIFSKCLPRPESTYVQASLPLRGPLPRARSRTYAHDRSIQPRWISRTASHVACDAMRFGAHETSC